MSPEIRKSVKRKYKLFKRFLNSNNSYHYKQYVTARNEASKAVKKGKVLYEKKIATESKLNPKAFWNYVNSFRKCKEGVSPLTTDGLNFATDDKTKSNILNDFFSSVFTSEYLTNIPSFNPGEKFENVF